MKIQKSDLDSLKNAFKSKYIDTNQIHLDRNSYYSVVESLDEKVKIDTIMSKTND